MLAVIAMPITASAQDDGSQWKSEDMSAKGNLVKMYCTVYNGTRVQITYNNPTAQGYTCNSMCYYSINGGPTTTLDCTGYVNANTPNGFFCGSNSYSSVKVVNAGNNNCP